MEKQVSGEEYRQMSVTSRDLKKAHKRTVTIPVVWILLVIVVGGLSFYGGVHYEKHHLPKTTTASTATGGTFGRGFGGENSLRAFGTVSSVSSSSITVEDARSNSSSTYNINSSTKITDNGQTVTASDIQTGATVVITKTSSSSSTASAIQVNPSFGGGFGGGIANPGSDSTSPSGDSSSDSATN